MHPVKLVKIDRITKTEEAKEFNQQVDPPISL
jgi:hypothetical protein